MTRWQHYALYHLGLLERQFGPDSPEFLTAVDGFLEAVNLETAYIQ